MRARPLRPLTPEEVDAFHRDGGVLVRDVLAPEWVEAVEKGLDEIYARPSAMSQDVGTTRADQYPATRAPALRRLIDESPIAEIVGTALRSPVRFYMDQSFVKPPGIFAPTSWHQDTCYFNIGGEDLIRAWVCCDPVPRNLSIEIVRGSHQWNTTYRARVGRDPDTDETARAQIAAWRGDEPMLGPDAYDDWTYESGVKDSSLPRVPDIESMRDSFDILGWDYAPGDVLLFHGNILHSARGHVESEHPRRAHATLWAGRDVHYLHRLGQAIPDPIALYEHAPRTGQLLSDFPDVFPLAWSPDED